MPAGTAARDAELVRIDPPPRRVVSHVAEGAMDVLRDFRNLKLRLAGMHDGKHRVAPLQKRIVSPGIDAVMARYETAADHEEHRRAVLLVRLEHVERERRAELARVDDILGY